MMSEMTGSHESSDKRQAHILWFDAKSECGFIRPVDGGPDLFVRPARVGMQFGSGQRISYTLAVTGDPQKPEVFIDKID
jgi:cold shock CspA family protein